jgi:hypothetical protein
VPPHVARRGAVVEIVVRSARRPARRRPGIAPWPADDSADAVRSEAANTGHGAEGEVDRGEPGALGGMEGSPD